MKKTYQLLATTVLSGVLIASTYAATTSEKQPPAGKKNKTEKVTTDVDIQNKKAIRKKEKSENELLKEVNKGVAEGVKNVVEATILIEKGKDKEAIKLLQEATGKFDVALAANPELALIPIDTKVIVNELLISNAEVKAEIARAEKLLKESKIQDARAVLLPLRDELVTTTSYLPMNTYPLSIKLATKFLVDGKRNRALDTLGIGLSTIVEEVRIIPLPLVRAESMITMAYHADKEKDKKKIHALLKASKEQLELAVNLGYSSKNALVYKDITTQIQALEKEVDGSNKVEPLYKKLIKSIKSIVK